MKISKVLINNDDKKRVDIIINLMTNYSNIKKGTMEQLFVCRTMVNYYIHYGNNEKASFYQNKIEELYEERLNELKNSQLDVYNSVKKVEKEISLLKKQMKKSEVLLALEPMTKLLNRASLLKVSSEFIDYSYKKKCCVGAIFIDIDFFKECNDTYGHAVGDDVIKTLANICKEFETNDIKFARYGGDEFFGITRNLSDEKVIEVACNISKKIREMNIPNKNNPNGHIVTISSGVVNVPITRNTDTIIEIANYADKALYYAKNNGKNAIYQLRYDIIEDNTKRASYIKIDC